MKKCIRISLQDHVLPYWRENCHHIYFFHLDNNPKCACKLDKKWFLHKINFAFEISSQLHDLNPTENFRNELEERVRNYWIFQFSNMFLRNSKKRNLPLTIFNRLLNQYHAAVLIDMPDDKMHIINVADHCHILLQQHAFLNFF